MQVALLAEDEGVKAQLSAMNITAESLTEIAPIQLRDASELAEAYTQVGRNDRIGLTGRPLRQLRTLATSTLYVLAQERLVFSPQCLNQKGFYLAMDNRLLIQRLKVELAYIFKHWDRAGQPIIVMPIKHNMLASHNKDVLIAFIHELQQGLVNQIPVRLGPLAELAQLAGSEKIDYLHDFEFAKKGKHDVERPFAQLLPDDVNAYQPLDVLALNHWEMCDDTALIEPLQSQANLYLHLEVLSLLVQRHGLDYRLVLVGEATVRDLLEEVYQRAGDAHAWYIVRRAAGLLGKYDINLEQAATDILVRQHLLTVGRAYSGKATLKRPTDSWEILQIIQTYNSQSEIIIVQELILYLGMLIKSNPELFADIHTLRVGHILQLILVRYKRDFACSLDHAFNQVLFLSPYELAQKVHETLADYSNTETELGHVETLQFAGDCKELTHIRFSKAMDADDHGLTSDWYTWREQQGGLGRENDAFYAGVWLLLHHCKGVMVGEKLNSNRRLDSELLLSQMTSGEQAFKLHVSHLLNKIQSSVYRQLTVEALKTMAVIVKTTPLYIDDTLIIDVLIGHAVRINWLDVHPEHSPCYQDYVAIAWQAFYQLPPHRVANTMVTALAFLLKQHNNPKVEEQHDISG
ncbi:glycoside hydrolase family 15 protein [Methylocucumis oryzae]|uniref:glycoside hydrolase family 15 protein n=1 Tax=Methylocucumis oryzae TaxID=1632867 RepID=UPI001EF9F0D1|nr:glycoside hydrolase family 15 protein [Methylocucumis oryzae]